MYCPSSVNPNGKLVKQTSGRRIKGKKVPGICKNNKNIETLINGCLLYTSDAADE